MLHGIVYDPGFHAFCFRQSESFPKSQNNVVHFFFRKGVAICLYVCLSLCDFES